MWKCTNCGLLIMFKAVTPEIDAEGIYFLCAGCGYRNKLINVGAGEDVALAQP
jgi:DNA-directed RNA polymerase subunit RPC12/RpoP